MLSAAGWSPSGSNLQPWNTYVLTGAPLAELKKRAVERVATGVPWDERQYEMYRRALKSPYRERRAAFGKERYSGLGIAREDWEARQRAAVANWDCFGAPAALFCYIDRDLGPAPMGRRRHVSADRHAAAARRRAAQLPADGVVGVSADRRGGPVTADGLILFCGMSIGYEDPTVSYARTGRGPARRDGHVRRRLVARLPAGERHSAGRSPMFDLVIARPEKEVNNDREGGKQ